MTDARKSNLIYIAFICTVIPLIVILFALSKTKERDNMSVDYNKTFDIGGYTVKITDCIYFSDTQEITFSYKYKPKTSEPTNSAPEIYAITYTKEGKTNQPIKYDITNLTSEEQRINCKDIGSDIYYITVNISSKEPDYYDDDTIDEFGDIIKGDFHEGKKYNFYVQIDLRDMTAMTQNAYQTYTTAPPVSTTTESIQQIDLDPEGTFVITTTTTSEEVTTTTSTSTVTTTTKTETKIETSGETKVVTAAPSSDDHYNNYYNDYSYNNNFDDHNNQETPENNTPYTTESTQTTYEHTTTAAYTPPVIKGLSIESDYTNNDVHLSTGSSTTLRPVITPNNAESKIIWESNRTDIAEVDNSGKVTAKSKGKAIIIARADDNSSITASCMITVE